MAFKTVNQYNEEKFGGFFLLRNDGDYADVIFLYQGVEDVLVADVHYLKSNEYSGYVHCCGTGCPACAKGIRPQTKLFIPVYNLSSNEIQFFDRTMRFEPQLQHDVFANFPNPSEYVFRITRHGVARDVNTTYEITCVGRNTVKSYVQILAENNATMPAYYNNICRELTAYEMQRLLDESNRTTNGFNPNADYSSYGAAPRQTTSAPLVEPPAVNTPAYSAPPEYVPSPSEDDESDASWGDELGEPQF